MVVKPELILGTAEFNPKGYAGKLCPSGEEITKILILAMESGIKTLDWSDQYGCGWILDNCSPFFKILKKSRSIKKGWYYHYRENENPVAEVKKASVYTLDQINGLKSVIIPFNINNLRFKDYVNYKNIYIRSVFDRGQLFKQGYTVKDCLDFVKIYNPAAVIVGVSFVKELEKILEVW